MSEACRNCGKQYTPQPGWWRRLCRACFRLELNPPAEYATIRESISDTGVCTYRVWEWNMRCGCFGGPLSNRVHDTFESATTEMRTSVFGLARWWW